MSSRPKLQDVATRAGVSIGTASHVLNNKASVSPETRDRVMEAAAELGYRLPARSNTHSPKKLSTIGVLIKYHTGQGMPIDPFYSAVLSGAEQECKQHNLSLMYSTIAVDDFSHIIECPPILKDHQVDGWLVLGAFIPETLKRHLNPTGVVLVDAYASHGLYDTIITDNLHGAYNAVKYLIEQGHRHIGLIGSTQNAYPSIHERRLGYLRALHDHGIDQIYIEDSPLHGTFAFSAAQKLLAREPRITAIFACNDDTAMAVMRAAYETNRRIPDDLSLIGFDDTDLASSIIPPLTTMRIDTMLMGSLAVRQLIDRVNSPDRTPITILMSTQLIVRQSVQVYQPKNR